MSSAPNCKILISFLSHSSTLSELKTNELRVTDMEYEDCHHVVWNHVLRHGDTMDFYDNYKKDYTYISGHVRVQKLGKGKCTKLRNIIDIDCGCSYGLGNSSLCCVRLDDILNKALLKQIKNLSK